MDDEFLASLINEYQSLEGKRADEQWATSFKSLRKIDDAINNATMPGGKKHRHQYRINRRVLKKTTDRLLRKKEQFVKARVFEDIMHVVEGGRVKGFGALAIYDTSFRIGLSRGILPSRVYLHAGTRVGAKRLRLDASKPYLRIDELPKVLQTLEAHHIENFLCIYKDDLQGSRTQRLNDCADAQKRTTPRSHC